MNAKEQAFPLKRRQGLRFVCGIVALLAFGYAAEIFFMGAPDFRKHSDRIYDWKKYPAPFWSEFTVFAIVGIAAAYYCIDWKKALPLIEGIEKRDQQMLASMPEEQAKRIRTMRVIRVVSLILGLVVIAFTALVWFI